MSPHKILAIALAIGALAVVPIAVRNLGLAEPATPLKCRDGFYPDRSHPDPTTPSRWIMVCKPGYVP